MREGVGPFQSVEKCGGIEARNRRILVIDDNPAIHADLRKILGPGLRTGLAVSQSEVALIGVGAAPVPRPLFQIDSALDGAQGLTLIRRGRELNQRYPVAFVDMRMPPGWDGLETAARIWGQDPHVQIVICTAYSDYSWEQILERFGISDRLVILKKPFDNIEVLQLTSALTEKWRLAREANSHLENVDCAVDRGASYDASRHEEFCQMIARLTAREREVMDMLVAGNTNKSIGQMLGVSPRTIETHRARVMNKMQADSLPHLVRRLLEFRLERLAITQQPGSVKHCADRT
jgi:two-component system, NtrC family, sensor kinase